ncbi:MAG: hypothetical protein E7473_02480 [Ruminococcaceae bacterium]|nr:hypothetical protein [Oscillospiraceae bacterium]
MKRFLSMVLTLALICTMLPTVFASEGEAAEAPAEAVTLEYVFNESAHPGAGYTATTIDTTDTSVSARWGYAGIYGFWNYSISDSDGLMHYMVFNSHYEDDGALPGALMPYDPAVGRQRITAIELEVTAAGTYNPSFSFGKSASGLIWEVHLIKNTNAVGTILNTAGLRAYAKNPSAATRLGFIDLYGSGTGEVSFPSVTLEKATYYLLMFPVGTNENIEYSTRSNGYHESTNYFKGITLTAVPTVGTKYEYIFDSQVFNLSNEAFVSTDDSRSTNTLKYTSTNDKAKEGTWYHGSENDTAKASIYPNSAQERYINPEKSMPWAYLGETGRYSTQFISVGYLSTYMDGDTSTQSHYAIRITVPEKGKYTVSILPKKYQKSSGQWIGGVSKIYVEPSDSFDVKNWTNSGKTSLATVKHYTSDAAEFTYEFKKAGSYVLVFEQDDYEEGFVALKEDESNTKALERVINNILKMTLTYEGETTEQKELNSEKEEVILPGNDGVTETVTAKGAIKVLTADISSKTSTVVGDLCIDNATIGESYTLTAPEIEGKEFLYWAKGIGANVAGFADESEIEVTAEIGATYFTAVYRDAASENISVEFYNGNGELWARSDTTYSEGDLIAFPENPTLTGYTFKGWLLAGGNNTLLSKNDTVVAEGKEMLFVAQYEDDANDVTVKVNGEDKTCAYGEAVTLTAAPRSNDGKLFAYWQKKTDADADAEIVSFDKAYTFRAYDGCEIEAVYRAYETPASTVRKILLGTSGEVNVAEFIGIGSPVEKGIIFGSGTPSILTATHKIKMNGDGDYLSALNDVPGASARGYAIFADGEILYSE